MMIPPSTTWMLPSTTPRASTILDDKEDCDEELEDLVSMLLLVDSDWELLDEDDFVWTLDDELDDFV